MPIKPIMGMAATFSMAVMAAGTGAAPGGSGAGHWLVAMGLAGGASFLDSVAGGLGADATKQLWSKCRERYVEGYYSIDTNHHVARGIRRAQLNALIYLTRSWRRTVREGGSLFNLDLEYADWLLGWCDAERSSRQLDAWLEAQRPDGVGSGQLREAFEAAFADDVAPLGERTAQARQVAEDLVLGELMAAGRSTPRPAGLLGRAKARLAGSPPQGDWSPTENFRRTFLGHDRPGSGWFDLFLRAIGQELKKGEEFQRLWLATQLAGISEMAKAAQVQLTGISKMAKAAQVQLAALQEGDLQILQHLRGIDRLPLALPDRPDEIGPGMDRFVYLNRWVPFVGRDAELERLDAFLDRHHDKSFRFALLHARGGEGKSRLALELCWHAAIQRGYHSGFLQRGGGPAHGWAAWRPDAPTLIVIDYAASRTGELDELFQHLQSADLPHPVRLLLLERTGGLEDALAGRSRAARSWASQWLEGHDSSGQRSIKESFAFEMALPPMGEASYEMMQAVYRAREVAPVSRDESLRALHAIGEDLPALFAVLVADALAAGETVTHEERYDFLVRTVDRVGLLHDLDRSRREQVLNIAAWTTLVRGLPVSLARQHLARAAASGCDVAQFGHLERSWDPIVDALRRLTGTASHAMIPPLEPDLLGSALIVSRCQGIEHSDDAAMRAAALHMLAWLVPPPVRDDRPPSDSFCPAAEALLRLIQDFPDHWQQTGLIAPPPVEADGVNRTYIALLADISSIYLPTRSLEQALAFYAANLQQPTMLADAPPEVRVWRAQAAFNLTLDLASAKPLDLQRLLHFYHHELQQPAMLADAPPEVRVWRAEAAFNLTNALARAEPLDLQRRLDFYHAELQQPAMLADAPPEVRVWRAKAAFNLTLDLQRRLDFYHHELQRPAMLADAPPEVRVWRAQAALNLALDLARAELLDLQRRLDFYHHELQQPALLPDAPPEVRVERVRAAFNLTLDLGRAEPLDLQRRLDFYHHELQWPALLADAPPGARIWRARAAFNLTHALPSAEPLDLQRLLDFYHHELQQPALMPDAPPEVRVLRARAAFNLTVDLARAEPLDLQRLLDFYHHELQQPAMLADAPEATWEWAERSTGKIVITLVERREIERARRFIVDTAKPLLALTGGRFPPSVTLLGGSPEEIITRIEEIIARIEAEVSSDEADPSQL